MATARIGDIDLYYQIQGSGPPLVLIMGFSGNSDWWPPQLVEALAARHRVVLVDNRGAGRSQLGRRTYTIPRLAADTVGLLDLLGIEHAHIFGVSMGGMIAQQIALSYPGRVQKLILGCTTCGLFGARFSLNHARLLKAYLTRPRVRSRPLPNNLVFSQAFLASHPETLECFSQRVQIAPMPLKVKIKQLGALFCFNSYPRLPCISAPTLVISGTADCLVVPRNSHILARRIPGARLVFLKGCGHGFIAEAEAPTARCILNFLAAG
jgi:pimeloyl-ACP methyl ester carboxylesterase